MNDRFVHKVRLWVVIACFLLFVGGVGADLLMRSENEAVICLVSYFPLDWGYHELIPDSLFISQIQDHGLEGVFRSLFISPYWLILALCLVCCGKDRWRIWMAALSWTSLFLWLVLPIVYCFTPALASSGMLEACWLLFLIYLISAGIYYVVVPVLWPQILEREGGVVGVNAVDPSYGKTIREITEEGIGYNPPKFLFGKADEELVAHWGMIGKAIVALSKTRRRRVASASTVLVLWPLLVFVLSGGSQGIDERNVEMMWDTVSLPNGTVVATVPALEAAQRVFRNDLVLRGLTRVEAKHVLRFDLMNPAYKLNKPRYSWEEGRMFLRISNGKRSILLQVGTNDEGKIVISWPESENDSPDFLKEAATL